MHSYKGPQKKGTILDIFYAASNFHRTPPLPATALYSSSHVHLRSAREKTMSSQFVQPCHVSYGNDLGPLSWKNPTDASHRIPTCLAACLPGDHCSCCILCESELLTS